MSWKKFFLGEPMPDKNDPKYKARYDREVAAGRKFADKVGISRIAGKLQQFGESHKKVFLIIVFGIVIVLFVINIVHLIAAYNTYSHTYNSPSTAVSRVDSALYQTERFSNFNK